MMVANKRKQRDQSPSELFADYPYPIIDQLSKECKAHEKSSKQLHNLITGQYYKDYFRKMIGFINVVTHKNSPNLLIEQSVQTAKLNRRASETLIDLLRVKPKPIRKKHVLASSMSPIVKGREQRVYQRTRTHSDSTKWTLDKYERLLEKA